MTRTSQLGHGVRTRHLQLCNKQCLYFNADADAIANAEMLMSRFSNGLLSIYRGHPLYPFLKIEKTALTIWRNVLIVFIRRLNVHLYSNLKCYFKST